MLQHVTIETAPADLDASVAFYALIGFVEVVAPAGISGRARWLQCGGGQIHLLATERPTIPSHGHLAIVAAEYEATLDALRSAGHAPAPRAEHWGAPRAYVRDPSGHLVELMAAPPPHGRLLDA